MNKFFLVLTMSLAWLLLGLFLDKIVDHFLEKLRENEKGESIFKKWKIISGVILFMVFIVWITKANLSLDESDKIENQNYISASVSQTVNASSEKIKEAYDQSTIVIKAELRTFDSKLDILINEKKEEQTASALDKESKP